MKKDTWTPAGNLEFFYSRSLHAVYLIGPRGVNALFLDDQNHVRRVELEESPNPNLPKDLVSIEYSEIGKGTYSEDKPGPFDAAIQELAQVLRAKNQDYAANESPFRNFEESAETAGITPRQSVLALIGTKLSRIRNLEASGADPQNESLLDSYLDLANYAIILYAMVKANGLPNDEGHG